ncbi:MAG: tRNA uridine-5-carboxymethylaminomethyl(34) synthesis GTPase MnmE [Clostridia bacterium]|nr:tRNA uridine-5-carboxymethylaminomethyl(34) synthesis GTPase MnmE [Clostridia bacterium]
MRTVAAVSTPRGKGGVAMIRITGPDAVRVAGLVSRRPCGTPLEETEPGRAVRTLFHKGNDVFDDGMATIFFAPRSFTGEDTAELVCHGGPLVTQKLLEAVFAAGAFPAGPGEFTRRAFQNGKMTLSQAEAVGGLIDAKTESHLRTSLLQCRGSLSKKLNAVFDELKFLLASVYAYIDYPDEDMTDVTPEEMKERLAKIGKTLEALCDSRSYGKAISEGIRAVIVGKPNTGKSAFLNMLTGEDSAIVTDEAGTTRDIVREQVKLGDLLLNLADTAGLRESENKVERIGIGKSLEALSDAELVFAVFDGSKELDENDADVLEKIRAAGKENATVCVMNKEDIGAVSSSPLPCGVRISALNGSGLKDLIPAVKERLSLAEPEDPGEILTNARQYAAIEKARTHVARAIEALGSYTQDIAGLDLEMALASLAEADGRTVSEAVVDEIFSHFCVGK